MQKSSSHILISLIASAVFLSNCASGGGGVSAPQSSTPSSAGTTAVPMTTNATTSGQNTPFQTAEYLRNNGLDLINAISAYERGATGKGVTVAIIDTGVDLSHRDLVRNVDRRSIDIIRDRNDLSDAGGHGTQVAGIIAAQKNDWGTHGVAYDARILSIRADAPDSCSVGKCAFNNEDIVAAIDYAVASGVQLINLSLGGRQTTLSPQTALWQALKRATDAGVIIVAAAGNDADPIPQFPASFAASADSSGRALIVGSVGRDRVHSTFSNGASGARDFFVVAPGESIATTAIDNMTTRKSGTSFAAPHVAGALALLMSAHPELKPEEAVDILKRSARDLGAAGPDSLFGYGLIDLNAAFNPIGSKSVVAQNGTSKDLSRFYIAQNGPLGDSIFRSLKSETIVISDDYSRSFGVTFKDLRAPDRPSGFVRSSQIGHRKSARIPAGRAFMTVQSFDQPIFDPERDINDFIALELQTDAVSTPFGQLSLSVGRNSQFNVNLPPFHRNTKRFISNGSPNVASLLSTYDWTEVNLHRQEMTVSIGAFSNTDYSGQRLKLALPWLPASPFIEFGRADEQARNDRFDFDRPLTHISPKNWVSFGGHQVYAGMLVGSEFELATLGLGEDVFLRLTDDPILATSWRVNAKWKIGRNTLTFELEQPLRVESGRSVLHIPTFSTLNSDLHYADHRIGLSPSGRQRNLTLGTYSVLSNSWILQSQFQAIMQSNHVKDAPSETAVWFSISKIW